jgi:hypothetical protein
LKHGAVTSLRPTKHQKQEGAQNGTTGNFVVSAPQNIVKAIKSSISPERTACPAHRIHFDLMTNSTQHGRYP